MRKYLFIILGFLGIVLIIELGIVVFQKKTKLPQQTALLAPTTIPLPDSVQLPQSQQNKKGVQFVKLSNDAIKAGYVGWNDGNFFFMAKKENNNPVYPFSFIGYVKKSENRKLEIEAVDSNKTLFLIKVELLPNTVVTKTTVYNLKPDQPATIQDIKTGSKVRIVNFSTDKINNGYFLIKKLYLYTT